MKAIELYLIAKMSVQSFLWKLAVYIIFLDFLNLPNSLIPLSSGATRSVNSEEALSCVDTFLIVEFEPPIEPVEQ